MAAKKKKKQTGNTIALNKKSRHDFSLGERFEAGLVLEGWEVKSLRENRVQMNDSYVMIMKGEAFLVGCLITPLHTASTHKSTDPTRLRKLLLHSNELSRLVGAVERKGFTIVPTAMYWKNNRAKLEISLAKGKQDHDKRATEKDRDWQRNKRRIMKNS